MTPDAPGRAGVLPAGALRVLLLVLFAAVAAYLPSLANDFAFDDEGVIVRNPAVTSGDARSALSAPWWPGEDGEGRLYRPLTQASFAMEWRLSSGAPVLFHAVNVAAHAAVSALATLLLLAWVPPAAAAAGGLLFAVHPVHVEAVANVVGRAELYAALAYVSACLLYLRGAGWGPAGRALRLLGVGALYLLALAAKESAVTLPLALALLEAFRPRLLTSERHGGGEDAAGSGVSLPVRLLRESPLYALLGVVLLAYLTARVTVLGAVLGEVPHPAFHGRAPAAPFFTGLALWPEYLRLMLFPLDLSADYDPAVLNVEDGMGARVVLGASLLAGLLVAALGLWRRRPLASLGILWFMVTVLPVSHLVLHPAVLLAERTLYLPSLGVALLAAALACRMLEAPERVRRPAALLGVLGVALLVARVATRTPSWYSSFTVMETLAREHPESVRAQLARAEGFWRVGAVQDAARTYEVALALVPYRYGTLLEAAATAAALGRLEAAEAHLVRATEASPQRGDAYRRLAEVQLARGRPREAVRTALAGLGRTAWDPPLWGLLAESWVRAGDPAAAARARQAARAAARPARSPERP